MEEELNSEIIKALAIKVKERLSTLKGDIKGDVNKWIGTCGLGRTVDPLYVVGIQAVFNAIARLILYEKISDDLRYSTISFTEIADEEVKVWGEAFRPYILDEVLEKILEYEGKRKFNETITKLSIVYNKDHALNDKLGELYEQLIPSAERRKLGQFFTPIPIADLMSRYIIKNVSEGVLVDPAMGTGRFVIRSLHQDSSIIEKLKIVSIDINPLMLILSAANLSYLTDLRKIEFKVGDVFDLTSVIQNATAIICNPPYSRHHELSIEYKQKLREKLHITSNLVLNRYASIFGYILPYLTSLLAKDGFMTFICPVEIFEARYSEAIKNFLASNRLLERVIVFNERSFVFPYAENAITILFVHKDSPNDVYFLKIRELKNSRNLTELLNCVEEGDYSWFFASKVKVNTLIKNSEWKIFYYEGKLDDNIFDIMVFYPLIIPFKLLAKIMRGIATGANDFFILNELEVRKWNVKKEYLKPALTKTRWVLGYVFDKKTFDNIRAKGEKCLLFYCMLSPAALSDMDIKKYIKYGEKLGLPNRSLIRLRKIWYQVERREPPPIVFTYLSRGRPRFIHNEIRAIPLNTFLCIYPVHDILFDEKRIKALLAYLNSNIAFELLKRIGRSYGGDTLKLEPRDLDELPVLDIRRLDEDEINQLAELFDELKYLTRMDDAIRKKIDDTIIMMLEKHRIIFGIESLHNRFSD
jgi:adenine-specific DNA-methyltransferase